jgi:hypothetical protein
MAGASGALARGMRPAGGDWGVGDHAVAINLDVQDNGRVAWLLDAHLPCQGGGSVSLNEGDHGFGLSRLKWVGPDTFTIDDTAHHRELRVRATIDDDELRLRGTFLLKATDPRGAGLPEQRQLLGRPPVDPAQLVTAVGGERIGCEMSSPSEGSFLCLAELQPGRSSPPV